MIRRAPATDSHPYWRPCDKRADPGIVKAITKTTFLFAPFLSKGALAEIIGPEQPGLFFGEDLLGDLGRGAKGFKCPLKVSNHPNDCTPHTKMSKIVKGTPKAQLFAKWAENRFFTPVPRGLNYPNLGFLSTIDLNRSEGRMLYGIRLHKSAEQKFICETDYKRLQGAS